jgi:hypothetical protein
MGDFYTCSYRVAHLRWTVADSEVLEPIHSSLVTPSSVSDAGNKVLPRGACVARAGHPQISGITWRGR